MRIFIYSTAENSSARQTLAICLTVCTPTPLDIAEWASVSRRSRSARAVRSPACAGEVLGGPDEVAPESSASKAASTRSDRATRIASFGCDAAEIAVLAVESLAGGLSAL